LATKIVTLVLLGMLLGFGYDWAVPRLYGSEALAGFRRGVVHGALMPVALPSLLLGKDVPIYASSNSGRTYKLGYIVGINLCGLLFFGLAFRRP
jgi:Mg/Co/Ni transporter MgtE